MIFNILENNQIVNTIIADLEFMQQQYPLGNYEQVQEVVIPAIPAVVTMRQARLALLQIGKLSQVDAAIATLPSPQKEEAQIEWQYSNEVQRHNGFVSSLAPALGLTEPDIDNLFIIAASK